MGAYGLFIVGILALSAFVWYLISKIKIKLKSEGRLQALLIFWLKTAIVVLLFIVAPSLALLAYYRVRGYDTEVVSTSMAILIYILLCIMWLQILKEYRKAQIEEPVHIIIWGVFVINALSVVIEYPLPFIILPMLANIAAVVLMLWVIR